MSTDNFPSLQSSQAHNPSAPKLYQYRPLGQNEIRVVDLLAGTTDDNMIVKVRHVKLQDNLGSGCIALSYTWGDPHDTELIFCSDGEGSIVVTKECLSALRRIRLPEKSETLWVDAICINQRDISERNHQVTLMSKIYHFSTKVAIYLGPSAGDSEHALEYLSPSHYDPRRLANMSPRQMDALRTLLSRPWFTRVWVIQEARNAKLAEVLCGDKSYAWHTFVNHPWGQHFFSENFLGPIPYVLLPPRTYWKGRDYAYNEDFFSPDRLFEHLVRARKCVSSDPRDKVFALLPLFKDADLALAEADLAPNYSDSAEAIFLRVAKYLIKGVGWALLYAVESGSALDLPSWCPDWSMTPSTPLMYSFSRTPHKGQFSRVPDDKSSGEKYPALLPSGFLRVHGARYDAVARVGQACDLKNHNWPEVVYKDWRSFMLSTLSQNATDSELLQEGYDRPTDLLSEEEAKFVDGIFTFMNDFPHAAGIAHSDEARFNTMNAYRDGLDIGYRETHDGIKNRCQGQRIFMTSKRRIGLGPVHTEVGDVVVCLKRATVPFLFRQREDGRHSFVSKCELRDFESDNYVRGIPEDDLEEFLLV